MHFIDCGTSGVQDRVSRERFRGVRIFDISDLKKPKQVAAVQTCRGSHTHTLVSMPGDAENDLERDIRKLETQFDKSILRRVKDNTLGIRRHRMSV